MSLLFLALSCAPTATPTRFFGASIKAGPTLDSVIVEFNLWDAAEKETTASGTLSLEIRRSGEKAVLCRGQREVARSSGLPVP